MRSARLDAFWVPPHRRRVVAALAGFVLVANLAVVVAELRTPAEAQAADVLERTPVPSSPVTRPTPTTTSTTTTTTVVHPLGAAREGSLPQPEPAPTNAYAATPRIHHGQLEIPSIGLSQPFFEGVTLTAINRGPSHWPGTAMPGGFGNVVIAGHRTTYTKPFWDLQAVQPGDELIFTMNDGTRYVYELERTEVVDESAVHIVDQHPGWTATLFACHPRGSARQRIVGHFVFRPPDAAQPDAPNPSREPRAPVR